MYISNYSEVRPYPGSVSAGDIVVVKCNTKICKGNYLATVTKSVKKGKVTVDFFGENYSESISFKAVIALVVPGDDWDGKEPVPEELMIEIKTL